MIHDTIDVFLSLFYVVRHHVIVARIIGPLDSVITVCVIYRLLDFNANRTTH